MKSGFFHRINSLIGKADVLAEVLDSRFPEFTRNRAIEEKVLRSGKKLVFVLNKSDLVSKRLAERQKIELEKIAPAIFVSSTRKSGINRLRELIGILGNRKNVVVGILGYPNTGKSSIINALKGKKVAPVSIKAGFTRGEQFVRLSDEVLLIDSPGIIPFDERNEFLLALIGSKNPEQLSDLELTSLKFVDFLNQKNPKFFEKNFGISVFGKNSEEILEELALKKGHLLKGGIPDTQNAARRLLMDWQRGKLKI